MKLPKGDLSSSYRSIIQRWFPNARIVADRFHVVRIILHHFITLCRDITGDYTSKNKVCSLLRTNPENLKARGKLRLEALFIEFPALKPIYDEIRQLHALISKKSQTKRQCRHLTRRLIHAIERLETSCFTSFVTLAATLRAWAGPIACMWRSTKNNGITEGFHRKMKLIQRRAYSFKNFDNYRLRVIAALHQLFLLFPCLGDVRSRFPDLSRFYPARRQRPCGS